MINFKHLLSPVKVGNQILKNRLLYPNAAPHMLQGPETFPAEGFRAFWSQVAKGAGVISIAEWNNMKQRIGSRDWDSTHFTMFDTDDPSVLNYISMLADDIHFHGSKLLISIVLWQHYPEGYSLHGGPAFSPGNPNPPICEPMSKEMIREFVDAFVEKMRFYKNLGYNGFEMRCDMDILPCSSMRTDEYDSSSVENRGRLMLDIYAAVQKAFGNDFIKECVVAWEQPYGYGMSRGPGVSITSDEVMRFCKMIDPYADIFQVRENSGPRSHPTGFNSRKGQHPAADFCARMKREGITSLLMPIGGFQDPEEMERLIAENKCDMIGAARAFIADYDYIDKMNDGRADDITPCIKCNKCHGTIHDEPDPWISVCTVNPRHSNNYYLHRMIKQPVSRKKVAVIGGGCAGMYTAITAAERGHKVTLFEKTDRLGGQLIHSDVFSFKWPIHYYKNWLVSQLGKLGVDVIMNCAPTQDMITAGGYDALIAATGATPSLPASIKGLVDDNGKALYHTCYDVFMKQPELGKHVIIVGASEVGVETGMHLAENGHDVTLLTRQNTISHDSSRLHYITMDLCVKNPDGSSAEVPAWFAYENLKSITNVTTKSVEGGKVIYVDAEGAEHSIMGDSVVICGGIVNCTDEALEYAGLTQQFFMVGNCNGANNIQVCVREAFSRASAI